jgi:phage gp29-like protein
MPKDFTEPTVQSCREWTPATIRQVESSADSGELRAVADLCDRLMADDRGRGVLSQRAAITRLPLTFEGGRADVAKRLADGEFWKIVPSAQIQQLHRWFVTLSLGLGRLQWFDDAGKALRSKDGLHQPVVQAWSTARHLRRDTENRRWECEVGSSGEIEIVTPGSNGWLLWAGASDRPWSLGTWRATSKWWLLKQYALEDWARYSERHGQGTLWVKAPGTENVTKRRALARELKQMGSNGVIPTPKEYELELIEATAKTYETFKAQIEMADAGIAIANLGQNLTSKVESGALASTRVHEHVASNIIASDVEELEEFVHAQILQPWALANWGSVDVAPWPKWDSTPPQDSTPRIQSWNLLLDVHAKARASGVPFDVQAAAEEVSMPWIEGAEVDPPETEEPDIDDGEEDDDMGDDKPSGSDKKGPSGCTCGHGIRAQVRSDAKQGERDGQEYADAVGDSMQLALALDLEPHLAEMVRIVAGSKGNYARAQEQIEAYYRDKVHAGDVAKLVRAGLTMIQLGGWKAVRDDAPELKT